MAKSEIIKDERGYRSVNRTVGPAPPTQEQRIEARLTALEKENAELKAELRGMTISGVGFSGSGPKGIKFRMPEPTISATINCEADPPTITINVDL